MTPFLLATLFALVAGGGLAIVWRERRALFARTLAAVIAVAALALGYVWWVEQGYTLTGERGIVTLSDLKLEQVAGSYRLQGQVNNASPELAVSAVPVRLRVSDCPDAATTTSCSEFLDMTQPLLVSVTPGGSRPFILVFNATPTTIHGTLRWQAEPGAPRTNKPVVR